MKLTIRRILLTSIFIILTLSFLYGCGMGVGGGGRNGGDGNGGDSITEPDEYTVTVSWKANLEKLVNSSGGGYRVYYSKNPGFSINDTGVKVADVPYISGPTAPTSTSLTLDKGTWYVKVVAYINLHGESKSLPSEEKSITLP